jgi:hypothetical protein
VHVGRHPGRLCGAEVESGYRGRGVLVGEVHGPDAGAGADVEDVAGGGADGGEEEAVVQGEEVEMVPVGEGC